MNDLARHRFYLKSKLNWMESKKVKTDQEQRFPRPDLFKPFEKKGSIFVHLPFPEKTTITNNDAFNIIMERRSKRKYTDEPLSVDELSWLVYASQGVKEIGPKQAFSLRTVPSGGARHTMVTYIAIMNVNKIESGVYRYLPQEHQLVRLHQDEKLSDNIVKCCHGQAFAGKASVVFFWSSIPYRSEWRYHLEAHRYILMDAGHACQNLYLASGTIGAGTCAIGAYDQIFTDNYLKLDGANELTIYAAAVGKIKKDK
ncbi:MAG: SagB/ThcOx family dehydrogenase [Caldisericia bacterium]|nr:SagB/ThcOx family dehydrogenase [Caldisericia bacterium]